MTMYFSSNFGPIRRDAQTNSNQNLVSDIYCFGRDTNLNWTCIYSQADVLISPFITEHSKLSAWLSIQPCISPLHNLFLSTPNTKHTSRQIHLMYLQSHSRRTRVIYLVITVHLSSRSKSQIYVLPSDELSARGTILDYKQGQMVFSLKTYMSMQ